MTRTSTPASSPAVATTRARVIQFAALAVVALVMLLSGIGPAQAQPDTYPADVTVTRVTPSVLTTGDEVTVRVEITNTSDVPLEAISLGVHLSTGRLESADSVDAWLSAGPENTSSHVIDAVTVEDPIEPGASQQISVTLTREQFGAQLSDAGVRGIGVEVVARRGESGPRIRQGMGRTVIPWWTERDAHPLAVIAPLTGPLTSPDDEEGDALAMDMLTAPGSNLAQAVTALNEVSWLTPAIDLTTVRRAQTAGPGSQEWARSLNDAVAQRPVIFLPHYDVDLAVVSQDSRAAELFARPVVDTSFTTEVFTTTIAVGAAGPVTDDMITTAEAAGYRRIIAPPSYGDERPPTAWTTSEELGAVSVHHGDAEMTSLFLETSGDGDIAPSGNGQAELAQSLLTVIGREEAAPLLVSLDRQWIESAQTVTDTAQRLQAMPWFAPMDAPGLLALQTPELTTAQTDEASPDVLSVDRLRQLLETAESVRQTAQIAVDPEAIITGFEPQVLAPLAVAARNQPARQSVLIHHATTQAIAMRNPIQLVPGSVVNLISQSGELPVQLTNDLEVDAEVMVILRPNHARLIAHPSEPVIVPAGGTATALVPVEAVGSGNVEVTVTIADARGSVVDVAQTMTVRVRADWETVGTAIIGGVLVLGLIFGIVRTVRKGKGRSRARLASVPVEKIDTGE